MKKLNVINQEFGLLKIIEEHSKTRNGHIRYVCECKCGNKCNVLLTHLRQNKTLSCGCITKDKIGKYHPQWNGYNEISGNFWSTLKRNEKGTRGRKKLEFTITIEYIWDLYVKQNRKCVLTGLDITFPKHGKDKNWTASLDRIDSSKGYIIGNVQWVNKDINIMKNKFNEEYFIKMCKLVSNNNSEVLVK